MEIERDKCTALKDAINCLMLVSETSDKLRLSEPVGECI